MIGKESNFNPFVKFCEILFTKLTETYYHHRKSFLTFIMMGIGTTAIYIGVFSLFWYTLHINHIFSVSIAFVAAAAFQFFANRNITFKGKGIEINQELFRYCFLLALNYSLSIFIMQSCIWLIHSPFAGVILTSIVNAITGYVLFKYWIFKKPLPI